MMFDSGKTSAIGAVGTRRAGGGDPRDDYDFCWFLLVFVVFLMFFSATGEMKRE